MRCNSFPAPTQIAPSLSQQIARTSIPLMLSVFGAARITPSSFQWVGERTADGGSTWQVQAEFFARRMS